MYADYGKQLAITIDSEYDAKLTWIYDARILGDVPDDPDMVFELVRRLPNSVCSTYPGYFSGQFIIHDKCHRVGMPEIYYINFMKFENLILLIHQKQSLYEPHVYYCEA